LYDETPSASKSFLLADIHRSWWNTERIWQQNTICSCRCVVLYREQSLQRAQWWTQTYRNGIVCTSLDRRERFCPWQGKKGRSCPG